VQRDPSVMTPAELRCLRESLGLTITELAVGIRHPGSLNERTVRRWESGPHSISKPNAEALARLVAYTDDSVRAIVEAHRPGAPIITYWDDEALHKAEPGLWPSIPASWHRAVAWRAAQQIPGAVITYFGE